MSNTASPSSPKASPAAIALFVTVLVAFVVQSTLTQHVQVSLGFTQPYMLLYIGHSTFTLIFPCHILYLTISTGVPAKAFITGLTKALQLQLAPRAVFHPNDLPFGPLIRLALYLTAGVTVPALLWYIAVSLTSISDITAIWNTNAIWALLISSYLYNNAKIPSRKLIAVLFACIGVFLVVYGDGKSSSSSLTSADTRILSSSFIGNGLTLIASIVYAIYQVLYKRYATFSSDVDQLASDTTQYQPLVDESILSKPSSMYPPPFALYPNFLTSCIGVTTLLFLWPALPLLDYIGAEPFQPPGDLKTWIVISGIATAGVVFNAGFMVLLGLWGPVLVSVGNLLTICLMLIVDVMVLGSNGLTLWSLLGCGMIAGGFAVLAWEERPE